MDVTYPDTAYHQSDRGDDMEGMLRDAFNMHNHGVESFPADFMASDDCNISGNAFTEPGSSVRHEEPNGEAAKFYVLLNDMNKELERIMFQIFPINIKGAAGSLAGLTGNICSWTVSYNFNFLFQWSSTGTFFIFSASCGVCVIFIAKIHLKKYKHPLLLLHSENQVY
ncbi:hypothetical protein GOBAR_DD22149 [Gossypium barbadense]|nr:hypothetical protein GOBAR_DD22149 [Gossypium barbadense]